MHAIRFESGAVVKRLGFLVEALELAHPPSQAMLEDWQQVLAAGISKKGGSYPRDL